MCDVVDLDARRKAKAVRSAPKARMPDSDHYFCMKCDADQFRLYQTGEVHCVKCGALMQNLVVGER